MTASDTTDRIENPHRPAARPPVLTPHPFRPGTFAAGVALTASGAIFFAQQVGAVALGPLMTVAIVTLAAAVVLIGVAIGWSRRAGSGMPDDDGEDRPEEPIAGA